MFMLTPWVKRILIANFAVFLVMQTSPGLARDLMFYPPAALFRPWTVVTYMFLHANLSHIVFNMIGVLIFGPRIEQRLGGTSFIRFYLVAGIGGALLQTAFATAAPMLGASGAVYAIIVGFAYFWPKETIVLFPIPIPIQAWVLATGYIGLSVFNGITGSSAGVAHFAHLGGAAFGFGFLKWWEWRQGSSKRSFKQKLSPDASPRGFVGDRVALARWKGISVSALHELNREEVERLLAKVSAEGPGSLLASEREFLDRMASG